MFFKRYFYVAVNLTVDFFLLPFRYLVNPIHKISPRLPVSWQRIWLKIHTHFLRYYWLPWPKPFNPGSDKVIIFLPQMAWNDLMQRPHHLPRAFARAGWTAVFMTTDIGRDKIIGIKKIAERLYICSRVRLLKKISHPWIYSQYTVNMFYLKYFKEYKLIYDHVDKLEIMPLYNKKMLKEQRLALNLAKVVMATSDALRDEILNIRKDTLLIPNAVFPDDFMGKEQMSPPPDLTEILIQKKPVIGYYGILAKWKMDYELIRFTARELPGVNIVIIGPDYDHCLHEFKWDDCPNVYFLGGKNYSELPLYARYFNVAMLPLLINDITNSISPVKLFEFLAMNIPVVSTNIAECRNFESVIIAGNSGEFVQQIKKALLLKNDPGYKAVMNKELAMNTWDFRCKMIIQQMEKTDL
ncbi:MAG TPA: glycosyltransferase [Bacteroidales bacterium]|nr:glycosyltransferase [Bacteroidales bacterium]